MHLGNEKLDLIAGEADLALRVGTLPDSNLVARKLGSLRTQVFASPAYIERYGEPLHPDELQFHRILAMRKARNLNNNRFFWQLGENGGDLRDFPVNPLLVANDPSALNGALVCGEGLLLTGDVMAKPFVESGMVRRVLAGWTGPEVDFNAVFAGGRLVSPKVRAFVDFLVAKLDFDANYMLAQCPNAKFAKQQSAQAEEELQATGKRILETVTAT
jgi:DNA-binding transcriptional LysR family regulator